VAAEVLQGTLPENKDDVQGAMLGVADPPSRPWREETAKAPLQDGSGADSGLRVVRLPP